MIATMKHVLRKLNKRFHWKSRVNAAMDKWAFDPMAYLVENCPHDPIPDSLTRNYFRLFPFWCKIHPGLAP